MTHVIRILGVANGGPTPFDGQYLSEYDPDRPGKDPNGDPMIAHVVTVPDPAQALHFDNAGDAMERWRAQGVGVRIDGKPNRPLTAFTVEIEQLP